MPESKLKLIIDTNLWISYLLSNELSQLDNIVTNQDVVLLFSRDLLDEFVTVAQRPKFRKYFALEDLEILLEQLQLKAEFVEVTTDVAICRDLKDNFLLALAQDGKATHLITGDKDLLVLQQFQQTRILTLTTFMVETRS